MLFIVAVIVISITAIILARNGWLAQGCVALSGLTGFVCKLVGVVKLTDSADDNDVAGAILLVTGVFSILAAGALLKVLFAKDTTAHQARSAASDT